MADEFSVTEADITPSAKQSTGMANKTRRKMRIFMGAKRKFGCWLRQEKMDEQGGMGKCIWRALPSGCGNRKNASFHPFPRLLVVCQIIDCESGATAGLSGSAENTGGPATRGTQRILVAPKGSWQTDHESRFSNPGQYWKWSEIQFILKSMRLESVAERNLQQREIYYSGAVQGVGFRYTARALARDFAVSGFVRNLPDGRVQLVVGGEVEEIDRFLTAIRAELQHYIRQVQETIQPASGKFHGFEIRF